MPLSAKRLSRRGLLASLAGAGAAASLGARFSAAATAGPEEVLPERVIPSSGEEIPALGMGTWITFDVGSDAALRAGRFDLMQVHNLVDWETHLDTLEAHKAEGRIRYLGVTTSHGRRHEELETVMRARPLDFVQLTYNVLDREAEARLLPLAAERGQAVIVNRPFRHDALFRHVRGHPLPGWAGEIGCANWAQLFLKFILAHPAVTCAIPATSRVDHMEENMGALLGPLPDRDLCERIVRHVESL